MENFVALVVTDKMIRDLASCLARTEIPISRLLRLFRSLEQTYNISKEAYVEKIDANAGLIFIKFDG